MSSPLIYSKCKIVLNNFVILIVKYLSCRDVLQYLHEASRLLQLLWAHISLKCHCCKTFIFTQYYFFVEAFNQGIRIFLAQKPVPQSLLLNNTEKSRVISFYTKVPWICFPWSVNYSNYPQGFVSCCCRGEAKGCPKVAMAARAKAWPLQKSKSEACLVPMYILIELELHQGTIQVLWFVMWCHPTLLLLETVSATWACPQDGNIFN